MTLYHGTTISRLESIAALGILPDQMQYRTDGSGRAGYVYLSRFYAPAYALASADAGEDAVEQGLLIEVDIDRLDESLFRPDEDDVAYNECGRDSAPHVVAARRESVDLEGHAQQWRSMLKTFGNVAYRGAIPVSQLRRYARLSLTDNGEQTPIADFICEYGLSSKPAGDGLPSDVEQYGQLLRAFQAIIFDGALPDDLDGAARDQYGYLVSVAAAAGESMPQVLETLLNARARYVAVGRFDTSRSPTP